MQASVIIVVSTSSMLERLPATLHSLLLATPANTVCEFIVVNSTGEELDLSEYPVRVITTDVGLSRSRARNLATRLALGEAVVFLPVPSRPMDDWVVPLLQVLSTDKRAVLSPVLYGLDQNLWAAGPAIVHKFGWRWDLSLYRALDESYDYAVVLPGDCLALTKELFLELGGFDEGADECEELEFCTKAWLCGSTVRPVPESRVATAATQQQPTLKTATRVAETWFGSACGRFYDSRGVARGSVDFGQIAQLVDAQTRLQKHDISWLIDTFQPELGRIFELKGRYFGKSVAIVADGPSLDLVNKWDIYRHDVRIGLDYAATLFECDYAVALGKEPVRALLLSGKYQQSQLLLPKVLVGPDGVANVITREVAPRSTTFELGEPGVEPSKLGPPLINFGHPLHTAVHLAAFMGAGSVTIYGWDGKLVDGRSHTKLIQHYGGGVYLGDTPTTRQRYEFYARGLEVVRKLLGAYSIPLLRYSYA